MADQQQSLPGGFEPDLKRYRQASEPHSTRADAEAAAKAFYDDLAELRVKHRIRDVLVVYSVSFEENDQELSSFGLTGFGNQTLWESMAAFAYGSEKRSRETRIAELLKACD